MEIKVKRTGSSLHRVPLEWACLEGDTLVLLSGATGHHSGYWFVFTADEVAMIREALDAGEPRADATIASLRKRLELVQS